MLFARQFTVLMILLSAISVHAQETSRESQPPPPTVTVNSRDELVQAIRDARPGTAILIAPGTYRGGLQFAGITGAKDRPVVLAAADPDNPPVFKGGASCLHLTDPAFVELRDLVLTGATVNGLNIDDGGSYGTPARHVVLHNLRVRDIGPEGNRDGIKLSGVDDFVVRNCTIERWGSGGSGIDMVGCHRGVIAASTFRHRGDNAANGVQTKGGSSEITIQWCRFENAGGRGVNIGGSTGRKYFRPKPEGFEARDITVEDCTFIGSMAPACFVGVDGAVVRYNTIYRPGRWIVRILQESQGAEFVPCQNGSFEHNLVVFRADELRTAVNVGGGTAPQTFKFSNNAWYCLDEPRRSGRLSLPVEETDGRYGLDPQFVDEAKRDLRLKPTSPVRDAGVRPQKDDQEERRE